MSYGPGLSSRALTPLENYTATEFDPSTYDISPSIEAIHNFPRFGNPNDFTDVINSIGDSEATTNSVKEYAIGIFAGGILILSIAVLWFFVIAILKIAGPEKVGFFTGRLIRPTSLASTAEGVDAVIENEARTAHQEQNNHALKSFDKRVVFVRVLFVLCGILTIIASILFYTEGVTAFKSSIDAMTRGIDLIQDVAYGAINVTDNLILSENQINAELDPFTANTTNEPICRVTDNELSSQIRDVWSNLVTSVSEMRTLIDDNLGMVSEDLETLIQITEDVKNQLTVADIVFWILIIVSIFIICLIAIMIGSTVLAAAGISNLCTKCITAAVIWPIFTLLLILSWILSVVFLIASLSGADFCMDPDTYVLSVVDKYQGEFKSSIFSFLLFYISGCTVMSTGQDIFVEVLDAGRVFNQYTHQLANIVGNTDAATIAVICGVDAAQAQSIQQVSNFLHNVSHLLNSLLLGLLDLLSCKSVNPIYTTFIYDALCGGGVHGLIWIFFTMLTIALSSMMMITFRAGLYPIKEKSDTIAKAGETDVLQYQQQHVTEETKGEGDDEGALEPHKAVQIY